MSKGSKNFETVENVRQSSKKFEEVRESLKKSEGVRKSFNKSVKVWKCPIEFANDENAGKDANL